MSTSMSNTSVDIQQGDRVKDSSVNSNPLYASAVTAIQAGLAATARKYAEMDSATAKKNPVRGTIPYDNDKSVFYN